MLKNKDKKLILKNQDNLNIKADVEKTERNSVKKWKAPLSLNSNLRN